MEKVCKYLKKLILGTLLIYSFNVLAINFNLNVPINLWTILFVGVFDLPGIVVLVLFGMIGVRL